MAKLVRDEKTPNLGLPLPDVLNDQTVDCQRIAQSFTRLDEAYGEVRLKTTEAVEKAEEAVAAKADAARALEVSESSKSAADTALEAAREAATLSVEAKSQATTAKTTAEAAVPRQGARGALAGYEVIGAADSLGEPPTVTIESPDCLNLETSGTLTLTFTAADPSMRAVKALSLTASETTTLTIGGAVWQNNGDAPEWGTAGAILVLLAHFVGGRVVLSVADNTEG
ncbi:MAG: hypothetical protein K1W05_06685 [Desulfovibrio sp.]|jgi:hypothetical protein